MIKQNKTRLSVVLIDFISFCYWNSTFLLGGDIIDLCKAGNSIAGLRLNSVWSSFTLYSGSAV